MKSELVAKQIAMVLHGGILLKAEENVEYHVYKITTTPPMTLEELRTKGVPTRDGRPAR